MAIFRLARTYKLIKKADIGIRPYNKDRSFCDFCGRQLSWYENVPILSWILQMGKTRCCGKKLPLQYPLLEISTGLIFLQIYNFQIYNFQTMIIYLVIASLLMFSLVFDLKYMILPDRANMALVIVALILILGRYGNLPLQYIYSGLGALLFFFILNRIKIRGSEAMGMGDVKYSLFMGLFLGWPNIIVAIYFAFVVGAIISIILMLLKIVKKENPIPFGPFLILGTAVAKIWGEQIIKIFFGVLF